MSGQVPLLVLRNLSVWLGEGPPTPVLRELNFEINPGEIVGLVGESGSGKSMTARAIIGSLPNSAQIDGTVLLGGEDLYRLAPARFREIRAKTLGVIFQDPRSSVDPLWTVEDLLTEGLRVHGGLNRDSARGRAIELLRQV